MPFQTVLPPNYFVVIAVPNAKNIVHKASATVRTDMEIAT
jgi:hypothetical protein